MVTNYPHSIASHDGGMRPTAGDASVDGLGGRVIDRLRQLYCGLHGHDTLLQFEQDRMFLRCVSCGHETPGWELGPLIRVFFVAGQIPDALPAETINHTGPRPPAIPPRSSCRMGRTRSASSVSAG